MKTLGRSILVRSKKSKQGDLIDVPGVQKVENRSDKECYQPHLQVLNPNNPGRVHRVLNRAAKFHGASLNKYLLTGPDQLQKLIYVYVRYRQQPYAVSADIEGMFLQAGVLPSDQPPLCFLWREDPKINVVVHQYTRHIVGSKDSPTWANYALQRTARDNAKFLTNAVKPSLKTFTWNIILAQWSLLRKPSVDRRNWYFFCISVG